VKRPGNRLPRQALHGITSWLKLAIQPSIVRRATAYAVVVGTLLVAINHWEAVVSGRVSLRELWQIALTVLVPYLVSTSSSVGAMRHTDSDDESVTGPESAGGVRRQCPPGDTRSGR